MKAIPIHGEYITLGQFLKVTDCVSTGGQVKIFLEENELSVNGLQENRRGKKLYPNDVITIGGVGQFRVVEQT